MLFTGSLALIDNVRERPIFLGELADATIVMVKAADRPEDEPGAEDDQAKIQEQQWHQQWHHVPNILIT